MHEGHRGRLRERARRVGLENFAYHEALELLLTYAKARGDVNPLAHELLDHFGSFKGVLEAGAEQLMSIPGVGEETATLLSMMVPMMHLYQNSINEEWRCLMRYDDAERYCRSLLSGLRNEQFYVICLSAKMQVLGTRLVAEGSLDEVASYPRIVAETALNLNAFAVLVCHNHPGGSPEPSAADLSATAHLARVLMLLDIRLIDHFIVGETAVYSMNRNEQIPGYYEMRDAAMANGGRGNNGGEGT